MKLDKDRKASKFSLFTTPHEGDTDLEESCETFPLHSVKDINKIESVSRSRQVYLKWEDPPKRVLFLTKQFDDIPDPDIFSNFKDAITYLLKKNMEILVEQAVYSLLVSNNFCMDRISSYTYDYRKSIDFVITFGGDGLLMHANALFGGRKVPPTMCFDFGSLGFLAPFSYSNFKKEVDHVMNNPFPLTLRMRLLCEVHSAQSKTVETYIVLNEAVIDRGPSPFLSNVEIFCDSQYLTTVQGDGIIIATPTGSTAYSLSAGGSMIHPSVPAILLTPICAHTLSFRPLILPDASVLTCIVPEHGRASGWVSFDGQFRRELQKGDFVRIKMCQFPMVTINRLKFTADWFEALRSGFMFNQRPRQGSSNMDTNNDKSSSDSSKDSLNDEETI